jgi:hypothetical protein
VVEGANDLTGQGSVYTRRVAADEDMMVVTSVPTSPRPAAHRRRSQFAETSLRLVASCGHTSMA